MQLIPHGVVSCSNLRDFRRSTVQKNRFTLHYFIRRLSMIVWVNVVLNRTVVVDSESSQQQPYSGLNVHPHDHTQPTYEMTPEFKPFIV